MKRKHIFQVKRKKKNKRAFTILMILKCLIRITHQNKGERIHHLYRTQRERVIFTSSVSLKMSLKSDH